MLHWRVYTIRSLVCGYRFVDVIIKSIVCQEAEHLLLVLLFEGDGVTCQDEQEEVEGISDNGVFIIAIWSERGWS